MRALALVVFSLTLALPGCGEDGGSSRSAPANRPPTITSADRVSIQENVAGTFHTVTATDPDGDALTYSLSGGEDAGIFSISSTGALSFRTPPDYEGSDDADHDNVYRVEVSASDGPNAVRQTVSVALQNAGPDAFQVVLYGSGFDQPVFVAADPSAEGVFVLEKAGRIKYHDGAAGTASRGFLDVSAHVRSSGEGGLLGFTTAPDYGTGSANTFYVLLTNLAGDIELRRYRATAGPSGAPIGDPASGDVLLVVPHPNADNHYGGTILFGPDGFLYITVGDGGGGAPDPLNNAQSTNSLLGKVLRIDVTRDAYLDDPDRDYAIPLTNPFASAGGRPEIWALGLRNPYRASFEGGTGNLWIGDVGQDLREEIDLLIPQDSGANLGWSFFEGTSPFRSGAPAGLVAPVAEYAHGTGARDGKSIIGGYVYKGPVESLRDHYIFADFIVPNIWSVRVRDVSRGSTVSSTRFTIRTDAFRPAGAAQLINNVSSFGVDRAGWLYIVDFSDGQVFRVEPVP